MNEQQHEMILKKTHSSGKEEWYCPACGRRMLINWHPQFKKTILEAGDNYAMHSATKGLMPMGPLFPSAGIRDDVSDENIGLWQDTLDSLDLDW